MFDRDIAVVSKLKKKEKLSKQQKEINNQYVKDIQSLHFIRTVYQNRYFSVIYSLIFPFQS